MSLKKLVECWCKLLIIKLILNCTLLLYKVVKIKLMDLLTLHIRRYYHFVF